MTNDFDDLASAYLDGQLDEADAARVERDPELQAEVDALRAVTEAMAADVAPVDDTVKERHLATALDAFTGQNRTGGAVVTDLDRRRLERDRRVREVERRERSSTGPSGLPRWLGVAAALLVVVGGIGFLSRIQDGSDDSADVETATPTFESAATADEAEAEAATEEPSAAAADRSSTAQLAPQESAADEAGGDVASAEGAERDEWAAADDEIVESARLSFDEIPDDAALRALLDGELLDPSLSSCAETYSESEGRPVVWFVPVRIGGRPGELLFVDQIDGGELVPVILDPSCRPFA